VGVVRVGGASGDSRLLTVFLIKSSTAVIVLPSLVAKAASRRALFSTRFLNPSRQ